MVLTFLKREQFQTNQSLLKTGNFWLVFFLVGLQISSRMSDLKISVCRQEGQNKDYNPYIIAIITIEWGPDLVSCFQMLKSICSHHLATILEQTL